MDHFNNKASSVKFDVNLLTYLAQEDTSTAMSCPEAAAPRQTTLLPVNCSGCL